MLKKFAFVVVALIGVTPSMAQAEVWSYQNSTDAMTDSQNHTAWVMGDNGSIVTVLCHSDVLMAGVMNERIKFWIGDIMPVRYRTDTGNIVEHNWRWIPENMTAITYREEAAAFAKAIAIAGSRVVVEADHVARVYSVADAAPAITPVLEACGY